MFRKLMGPEVRICGALIDPERVHLVQKIFTIKVEQDVGNVDRSVVS